MTEEALRRTLAAVRAGEEGAFERLYRGLAPGVYTFLLRLVGPAGAEDLLQELFLRLFETPPGPEVRLPRAWIFKAARNLALDELRTRREGQSLETLECPAPREDVETRMDVAGALEQLEEGQRQIVTLYLNGGLKFREVAQVMELPLGTVLSRYHRAIGKLREFLST